MGGGAGFNTTCVLQNMWGQVCSCTKSRPGWSSKHALHDCGVTSKALRLDSTSPVTRGPGMGTTKVPILTPGSMATRPTDGRKAGKDFRLEATTHQPRDGELPTGDAQASATTNYLIEGARRVPAYCTMVQHYSPTKSSVSLKFSAHPRCHQPRCRHQGSHQGSHQGPRRGQRRRPHPSMSAH